MCVYNICINVSGHTGFNCCRGKDPTNIFVLLVEINCLSSCMCVLLAPCCDWTFHHNCLFGVSTCPFCNKQCAVCNKPTFSANKSPHLYTICKMSQSKDGMMWGGCSPPVSEIYVPKLILCPNCNNSKLSTIDDVQFVTLRRERQRNETRLRIIDKGS